MAYQPDESTEPQPASEVPSLLRRRTLWFGPAGRPFLASGLALLAAGLVLGTGWARRAELGQAAYLLLLAALLCAGAAILWLTRRPLPARALLRRRLAERRRQLAEQQAEFAAARIAFAQEADATQERLAARELRLNNQLVTFHEWMEFPQPLSLDAAQDEPPIAELVEKDRQLLKLLDEETQAVFLKIQENAYVREGQFRVEILRDDAWNLVQRVARIYQPGAKQPLLETSFQQILRSASRVCLQSLIVMDRLPLNVKEFNLNSLYRYIRQAVSAYGVYKATEPYLPYLNTAYYFGRVALGANPVSIGAWWFLSQHGKKFAQDFTTRLVQRQILSLLRDFVRVVGFEAARVYSEDFNRRDANWIYGVELVELVRQVPLSPNSFACALQEVGGLQLRNEYDRIFLYRCLAAAHSAEPERYQALDVLLAAEREAVARRLESFHEAFRLRGAEQKFAEWSRGVEQRLGIQVRFQREAAASTHEQLVLALRSLASYLLEIKQREPQELAELLAGCRVPSQLAAERREQVLAELRENPPFFFEHPDIDSQGSVAPAFLEDLVRLAVRVPPHIAELDLVLANVAAYLRHDPDAIRKQVDAACLARFTEHCAAPRVIKTRMSPTAVRAALDLIGPGEQVKFVFGRVQLERQAGQIEAPRDAALWLMGVGDRIVLFAIRDERPQLLWEWASTAAPGDPPRETSLQASRVDGWLAAACRLRGGQWRDEAEQATAIVIPAIPLKRYDDYFRPLLTARGVVAVG